MWMEAYFRTTSKCVRVITMQGEYSIYFVLLNFTYAFRCTKCTTLLAYNTNWHTSFYNIFIFTSNILYIRINICTFLFMHMQMLALNANFFILLHCVFLFTYYLSDFHRISCLFVTDINVPEIVDFRDNVTLSCSYDMSGHTLNSVKWYKDKMEFFR